MLTGKKILLGVCGGIAAYKSVQLTRLLVKAGAAVKVVMTPAAQHFVGPITFSTLSKSPALWDFTDSSGSQWHNHVALGAWADIFVIAPLTANTLAKMAHGQADNLLLATYLSAKCPVVVAPAMDLDMYSHATTTHNLEQLKAIGNHVIPATSGELASGLEGQGRMAEPDHILAWLEHFFTPANGSLSGKHVLITAGPTREPIDPVRFISNHSSGKMGIALAVAAKHAGAKVTLVLGPTTQSPPANVEVVRVETALEMFDAVERRFAGTDIFIAAAAVADLQPAKTATEKIKKKDAGHSLALAPTKDILKTMGHKKQPGQLVIGFALETQNAIGYGQQKLAEKNLDAIVVNSLADEGAGFGHDTNKVTLLSRDNKSREIQLKPKEEVAKDIIQFIQEELLHA